MWHSHVHLLDSVTLLIAFQPGLLFTLTSGKSLFIFGDMCFLPTAFARSPSQPSWPPWHPWPKSNGSPANEAMRWDLPACVFWCLEMSEHQQLHWWWKHKNYENSAFIPHSPILVIPFHSCQLNLTGIWILILPCNFVANDATMLQWLNYASSTALFWGLSFCKSVRRFTSKRHQIRLNGETLSSTIITWQFTELTLTPWGLTGNFGHLHSDPGVLNF